MRQNKIEEQKVYKGRGHSSLLLVFLVCTSLFSLSKAESFADFRRDQSQSFQNYKEENDRMFSAYLKSDWEAYLLKDPLVTYKEQKPKKLYPAKKILVKKQGPSMTIDIEKKQAVVVIVRPVLGKKDIHFDFFGTPIALNIPQGMDKAQFYPQNKEGISSYYHSVALSPYELLVENIENISDDFNISSRTLFDQSAEVNSRGIISDCNPLTLINSTPNFMKK